MTPPQSQPLQAGPRFADLAAQPATQAAGAPAPGSSGTPLNASKVAVLTSPIQMATVATEQARQALLRKAHDLAQVRHASV